MIRKRGIKDETVPKTIKDATGAINMNILVIDDDPGITKMLKMALSNETCQVITAHDGREGLRLIRENSIDLVITDIIMPEVDGFEVIMEINKMDPWPQVIVITGGAYHLSGEYLEKASKIHGITHILKKPFTVEELLNAVDLATKTERRG
jgi:YesN/AraC family two-component response regulator